MEVRAKKALGQHFLVDQGIAQRIVAALEPSACADVLEIGPGMGVLTQYLIKREDLERTVGNQAVTRLALTLDKPAKTVKVTTVFRPEAAL